MTAITDVAEAAIPDHKELLERLTKLEDALLAKDPMMKVHLGSIHAHLIQYEELVHLLKDEEISVMMQAQQIHTNVILVSAATTKSGKAKAVAASAKIQISDL